MLLGLSVAEKVSIFACLHTQDRMRFGNAISPTDAGHHKMLPLCPDTVPKHKSVHNVTSCDAKLSFCLLHCAHLSLSLFHEDSLVSA